MRGSLLDFALTPQAGVRCIKGGRGYGYGIFGGEQGCGVYYWIFFDTRKRALN